MDKVSFQGVHCLDNCSEGPNLIVDGKMYHRVTQENVLDFLMDGLKELIN